MADLNTADVVTAVRGKLSDTAFDQVLIIDAMNYFISEIYHNTRTRRMETTDDIFASAGDTVADLPDDYDQMISFSVVSPNNYSLNDLYWEYGDFVKAFPKFATDTAKALQEWTDFGNQMRFSAPLLADTDIFAEYLRKPVLATVAEATATDTIELDEAYKELVVLGTLARCMESNEDYSEAQSERGNLSPLLTSWIRNEGRGGIKTGPTIMRSNRNTGSRYSRSRDW